MAMNRYPSNRRGSWPTGMGDWSDLFQGLMAPALLQRTVSTGAIAPVDVCERENEFIIRMGCAGCRPEDIDVTVEDDVVRIRGRFQDHEMGGAAEEQTGQQQAGQTEGAGSGTASRQGGQAAQTAGQSGAQSQMGGASAQSSGDQSTGQGGQTLGAQMQGQRMQSQQMQSQARGQSMSARQAPREQCLIRELPTGRFERDITLPIAVNSGEAQANFENGLLTLTLPKARAPQGRRIQIGQQQSTGSMSGESSPAGSAANQSAGGR